MNVKRFFAANCFLFWAVAGSVSLYGNDWAFTGVMPGGHRGAVSAVIHDGNTVISAGSDGFLEIWDTGRLARPARGGRTGGQAGGRAVDRFQVSPYGIIAMALRPGRSNEVSLIESNGLGRFRISAWNFRERQNIFTLHFRETIRYITYSAMGNFIIAARTGRTALIFIDASTGEILPSPEALTGTPLLALTGRTERNMVVYLASGRLSYWDITSGHETAGFNAPANLSSPVFFSNNRFLAGVGPNGLAIVIASSGEVLATDNTVPAGSLLYSSGNDFFCLIQTAEGEAELRRYTIDNAGRLVILDRIPLSLPDPGVRFTAMSFNNTAGGAASGATSGAASGSVALGTSDGLVAILANRQLNILEVNEKIQITYAAVSGSKIAFLTENGMIGHIPIDFNSLTNRHIPFIEENTEEFNRITAFSDDGYFIFWQNRNSQTLPQLRTFYPSEYADEYADTEGNRPSLGVTYLRSPLSSVSSFEERISFLDTAGNISVVSPSNPDVRPFQFSSIGTIDVNFIDNNRILLARSAIGGNTPFLLINVNTGETVPLAHPTPAGLAVHRGNSGRVFAAVISRQSGAAGAEDVTSIVEFNIANSAESEVLLEFWGEASQVSIAESHGLLAATVGGDRAQLRPDGVTGKPDRTPGLPLLFMDGGSYLISLDREGKIAWHQNDTGRLLAVFSLTPDGWILQTPNRTVNGRF